MDKKTITMTNAELYEASVALGKLSERDMNVRTALAVRKLVRAVKPHAEDVEKLREKLVDKYAKKDEDGNVQHVLDEEGNPTTRVKLDDAESFQEEFEELLEMTVELEVEPITVEQLEGSGATVAARTLVGLGDLIAE